MAAIPIRSMAIKFAGTARWSVLVYLAYSIGWTALAGGLNRAPWFPSAPHTDRFSWLSKPCEGCFPLAPRPEWLTMEALASLGEISFLLASDEDRGPAWSYAPNVVVVSPSALKLPNCQLAFLIGHELVHIAQRHFDEDAHDVLVLAGKPSNWTLTGETALGLLDGDFSLALRMSPIWQQQEREADWVGALLAAQACKCSLEESALSYFGVGGGYGGGLAAAHDTDAERIRFLKAFADSARKLSSRMP